MRSIDAARLLVRRVARTARDATVCTVFEGTSETQRLVIARTVPGVHVR